MNKFCIDASLFLGMNSDDEYIRISCKNFFIENRKSEILMSFEQVGICDNIIWSFPFELQSLYYPFMDFFHTIMRVKRLPFSYETIAGIDRTSSILLSDNLNISFAKEHKINLYTANPELCGKSNEILKVPIATEEMKFREDLEALYQDSLKLSINMSSIFSNEA